jgi:predicted porin
MNKKLLAFAVAAAFAAPMVANADSGNVTIGGTLKVSVDSLDNGNDRNWNVSNNSSNIWFKGAEDLGNGLKAVWQLTTYVGLGDTGAPSGQNSWTNGNSFLGLAGGFGTVVLGKHDTPFKILGRKVDLFGDQIGDSRNLISAGGATWDLRPDNVLAWITPTFSGFHAALAHVTNVGAGAATETSIDAWSALGIYENGPITAGLAYERHNMSNTGAATMPNDESAWRLAGGYDFGAGKVNALWQRMSDIGGGTTDRSTWGLGASFKVGGGAAKIQYTKAGDVSNTSETGATMWSLGYDHNLSKRTVAYAAIAKTSNDNAATFSAFGGGHGDNPGIMVGDNGTGFSLGLTHSF